MVSNRVGGQSKKLVDGARSPTGFLPQNFQFDGCPEGRIVGGEPLPDGQPGSYGPAAAHAVRSAVRWVCCKRGEPPNDWGMSELGTEICLRGWNPAPARRDARRTHACLPQAADSHLSMQHRLSEGARLSIILPTPQRKPWYRIPFHRGAVNRNRLYGCLLTSECLNCDPISNFPRSTE